MNQIPERRTPEARPPRGSGARPDGVRTNPVQGGIPTVDAPSYRNRSGSRSGAVPYGTTNNYRFNGSVPNRVDRFGAPYHGSLERLARRERVGIVYNGYRCGYVSYNSGWRDDYFRYSHYVFDPFSYDRYYCSPWYYYSTLPAYIGFDRITVVLGFNTYWGSGWYGERYDWRTPAPDYRANDLDYAVEDLVRGYERSDRRAIGRVVPDSGRVAIYMDQKYAYSIETEDFYDLMLDSVEGTRTRSYEILDVRRNGDSARVVARHEYVDPWGKNATVFHFYKLEYENGKAVVREFGTSDTYR